MEQYTFHTFAKVLIVTGVILIIIGLIFLFGYKIPYIGKLPGDIVIRKKNFTFYFPIMTILVLNLVFFVVMYIVRKLK
jgi:hypothetical protein